MNSAYGKRLDSDWTMQRWNFNLHQVEGMALKAIARALTRSEESVKDRAKADKLQISKLR